MNDQDLATDEEEFHSSFRIWLNAVEMLASSPEEQCRAMGNYNVAWELKEDVRAGRFLVDRGYLSPIEEAWVQALAAALEPVGVGIGFVAVIWGWVAAARHTSQRARNEANDL